MFIVPSEVLVTSLHTLLLKTKNPGCLILGPWSLCVLYFTTLHDPPWTRFWCTIITLNRWPIRWHKAALLGYRIKCMFDRLFHCSLISFFTLISNVCVYYIHICCRCQLLSDLILLYFYNIFDLAVIANLIQVYSHLLLLSTTFCLLNKLYFSQQFLTITLLCMYLYHLSRTTCKRGFFTTYLLSTK